MKITIKGKKPNGVSFNDTHTVTEEEFKMIDYFLSFDRRSIQLVDHSNAVIKEYVAGDGKVSIGHSSSPSRGQYIHFGDLSKEHDFAVGEDILDKIVKETDRTVVFFKNIESLEVLQNSVNSCRERLLIEKYKSE